MSFLSTATLRPPVERTASRTIGEHHVPSRPRDALSHRRRCRLRQRRHLLVNAAKRAEVIPTSAVTQLIAPLAQILALALVTALYLAFGRRTGTLGLVAYLLNALPLASLVGVEFVLNAESLAASTPRFAEF